MKKLFVLITILMLWPMGNARAEGTIRIVVYGDSLLSGYQLESEQVFSVRLEQKLQAAGFFNVDVVNMSVPGETTAGGLERIGSVLDQHPDIVILELGTNDAQRGIAIELIYKNLGAIVGRLIENKVYTILIGNKAPSSMGYVYDTRFEAIYKRLSEGYSLPLYPFILNGILGNQDLNLADGYHPNEKGVQVMLEQIYPLVDAGVRWKWETLRQYQQWQQQNQGGMPGVPPTH